MKRRNVSKKQKKKEMMHSLLPPIIAIVLIIIVVVVALSSGMFDSLKYSSQKADLYSYYNISDDDRAVIVRDGEITDETVPVFDGQPYVLLNDVNDEFNDRFYYDVESDSYLYTRADSIDSAKAAPGSITYMGGTRTVDYSPFVVKDEDTYIALEYLKLYKNLTFDMFGGNGEPYRITIREEWENDTKADMLKDQAVRVAEDKKSDVLKELKEGDSLIVLDKGEEWSKVETDDLRIGYIENKFLSDTREEPQEAATEDVALNIPSNSLGKPVIMAWHNTVADSGADAVGSILAGAKGLNVISPTWFTITDNNGSITSIGSKAYVDTAHAAGVQVWAVFDNLQHI